ncbi:Scr1 family TA system antitoxin-like transcriptional regulator [Streptomyces lunalinharesii]|uniref:Scr1 family TA system antitoxin-like transcriptional regulator n=1 Tax=Streptomyces lunalinharesii TaxID=333384 RepID=UPI0031DBF130
MAQHGGQCRQVACHRGRAARQREQRLVRRRGDHRRYRLRVAACPRSVTAADCSRTPRPGSGGPVLRGASSSRPTNRRKHVGLNGPLVLWKTPDHGQLPYVEGQRVSFLVEGPDEVSLLQRRYAMLRSQALTPEDGIGLLDRLAGAA